MPPSSPIPVPQMRTRNPLRAHSESQCVAALPPQPPPPAPPAPAGRRKKVSTPTVKDWAVVSADGATRLEKAGRHSIMRRTGLPARDLRVLDPLLSHPSTILGRERAVVVNLEHVRAVITAAEVFVPCSMEHDVGPLVLTLASWISASANPARSEDVEGKEKSPEHSAVRKKPSGGCSQKVLWTLEEVLSGDDMQQHDSPECSPDVPPGCGNVKVLPFEFRALEACLESACSSIEMESIALEKEAYPALDQLTSKVSTLNLERIRQIKSRFVALAGRVQKVWDELEHLLENDLDMAAMHLSEKAAYREAFDGVSSRFDLEKVASELDDEKHQDERYENSERISGGFRPNTQELEMLLEAYFVHIGGISNKLTILREYINDTEDYINIMLDDKQNQMLQMAVVLTTATMIGTITVIISGFLSINIRIPLYRTTFVQFWEAFGGLVIGGIGLFTVSYIWFKKNGFLQ